ncbi:MAG: VCBS repeat-containing protein [candidate division Zixibacteria bacterium]|nr:VCBS repeat-containing protein [candidate division Zixibacteria bacterium]
MRKFKTFLLMITSIVLLAGVVYAVDPLFDTNVDYGIGIGPNSVYAIDLDGDDDIDLAVANNKSDDISILLNNGDGTFQTAINYEAGHYPYSIFSIDLDGDGDNDLATDTRTLLNNGDGTFQASVGYFTGSSALVPWSVYSGDIDGDGDNDLAALAFDAIWNMGSIHLYSNNGAGSFHLAVDIGIGYNRNPYSVILSDLDGDGDNDLVASHDEHTVVGNITIYLNNGNGSFQTGNSYSTLKSTSPRAIFSTDFDGDGDNDLAVGWDGGGEVAILLNNGDGTFQPAVNYDAGSSSWSVFSADLDDDGDDDIVTNASYLLNNGDGTFQPAVNYSAGGHSAFSNDLDGDGDNDLVKAGASPNIVSIWMNLTNPVWVCGDIDDVEGINILDIVALINYEYKNIPLPGAMNAANVDGISPVNILDIVHLINNIYKGGPDPTCL